MCRSVEDADGNDSGGTQVPQKDICEGQESTLSQMTLPISPSAPALRSAQRSLDRRIETALTEEHRVGTPIYCASGCFRCCDMPITAMYIEAEVAVAHATAKMLAEHAARAKAIVTLARTSISEQEFLSNYRASFGFCPFLIEGRCGIYPVRPGKCRSTYSTRPPEFCADGGILALNLFEVQQYVRENEANPRVEGFTHYLISTESPIPTYQRTLMAEAQRRHGTVIYGDWSVMVTLAADPSFRQDLATAGRSVPRVQALLKTHPLVHPLTVLLR